MGREQTAVVVSKVGDPVHLTKRQIPTPQKGEVLIKVEATHLLPHDSYGRDLGLFIANRLPWVLGSDLAGTIESVGPSSTGFNVGDRVFGMSNLRTTAEPDQAGLQQYAILEADAMARIPVSVSTEDAITVPLNLITSFLALFTKDFGLNFPAPGTQPGRNYAAESLVIIGAGSNLAKLAIQLAKIVGIGTIIAIAGSSNEAELKRLGATHFVDRHIGIDSIKQQVHSITGLDGATKVYDCYSWTYELALALVPANKASRLVAVHALDPKKISAENPNCDAAFVQCSNANLGEHAKGFWSQIGGWLERGEILPASWKVIDGLEDVAAINAALDDYRDAKGGPQAIVKPRHA